MAAIVGAVLSSTMRKRNPSAMNNTTLCGRAVCVCARTGGTNTIWVKAIGSVAAARRSDRRMGGSVQEQGMRRCGEGV
jgi:hypothetical protein